MDKQHTRSDETVNLTGDLASRNFKVPGKFIAAGLVLIGGMGGKWLDARFDKLESQMNAQKVLLEQKISQNEAIVNAHLDVMAMRLQGEH